MKDVALQLPFTTSHAFIVGINAYQHLTPLSTAVNDAEAISASLEDQHNFIVHPPLLDATHEQLRKLLTVDIPKLVGKDDRVLFYFAGHGIALDGEEGPNGYLVAADTRPGQEETLIPMQLLHDALTGLPCRHGLLILDCCFSGAFKWSSGYRDVIFDLPKVIYEERFWRYCKDEAWQVITSSAYDQKAVDIITNQSLGLRQVGTETHSPFATSLLKALDGEGDQVPAGGGDGVMTATEIYTYLRDAVETATTENAKRQSPSLFNLQRHDKGEFIFLHPRHRFNLPPTPDRNPFMGLASYDEADSHLFYGRDRVVTTLLDRIIQQPLTVVSGASGTGKSSVLKAGVLPRLRKQGYTVLPIIRPGKEPLKILATELPAVEQQLAAGPIVLMIDQYEELITQCLQEEDRLAFEQQLIDWLTQYPELRILLSIRADFEPQFERAALSPWWQSGRYVVPAFSLEEIREVITKPAAQAVLFYEPEDLVEHLSEEVSQSPGALPLLSFTLSELYHAYLKSGREDRALTEEDYLELGGVIGALRTRADSIYDGLDPAHQSSMRNLILRMVSLEGGEIAGRRVLQSDLQFSDPAETQRLQTVARALVTARLIFTGLDSDGMTYYEPAHDALVRAWARLWEWIKLQGEGKLSLMYKLGLAVQDYQEQLTDEYLWHDDPRLDFLLADLQNQSLSFNAREENFLRKSKALQQRNKRRRWSWIVAVMIGLAGLAVYAFLQAEEAKKQQQAALRNADAARSSEQAAQDSATVAQQQRMWALLQADTARLERDNANRQTLIAQQARFAAEQKSVEARVAATTANARATLEDHPTLALNLALAAYHRLPTAESRSILHDIISNPQNRYYQRTLNVHDAAIVSIVNAPNGRTVLTGDNNNTAKLWTLDGRELATFVGHSGTVSSVAFSPDGRTVLTGSHDRTAILWTTEGEVLRVFEGHDYSITCVAFSPDGQMILTGSDNYIAKLWSVQGEELATLEGHEDAIEQVAFSADGEKMLTAGRDGTVNLWLSNGTLVRTLVRVDYEISGSDFSPDGATVLIAGRAGTVELWSVDSGQLRSSRTYAEEINSAVISPDGSFVLTEHYDNTAFLWSLNSDELYAFEEPDKDISSVAFSSDSRTVIMGNVDGTTKLWSLDDLQLPTFGNADRPVADIAFSPDGQMILTTHYDNTTTLWSITGRVLQVFQAHRHEVSCIAFSPDSKKMMTGSYDRTAKLWSLDGNELQVFEGHVERIDDVDFSPDGKLLLTRSSKGGTMKLWSVTGKLIRAFTAYEDFVTKFAFAPDGRSFLTAGEYGVVQLWSATAEELRTFREHDGSIEHLEFSPDGQHFLTASKDGTVKFWSRERGVLRTFAFTDDYVTTCTFAPDGKTFLTVSKGGVLQLWSVNGRELWSISTPNRRISTMTFSPDGQTFLIGDASGIAKLYLLTGQELSTFKGNGNYLDRVFFTPNGEHVITKSRNGVVKIWRNIYGEYRSGTLWDRVNKLTLEERMEYGIDWEY